MVEVAGAEGHCWTAGDHKVLDREFRILAHIRFDQNGRHFHQLSSSREVSNGGDGHRNESERRREPFPHCLYRPDSGYLAPSCRFDQKVDRCTPVLTEPNFVAFLQRRK